MRWQPRGPVQSLDASSDGEASQHQAHFISSDTKAHGISWMTGVICQKTVKTLVDQNAMKQTIDATKPFNNQYVSAANTLKR
jgi:hypothetical protein